MALDNLRVNDVLIIKEDFFSRNQWQLDQILETTVDSNGLV